MVLRRQPRQHGSHQAGIRLIGNSRAEFFFSERPDPHRRQEFEPKPLRSKPRYLFEAAARMARNGDQRHDDMLIIARCVGQAFRPARSITGLYKTPPRSAGPTVLFVVRVCPRALPKFFSINVRMLPNSNMNIAVFANIPRRPRLGGPVLFGAEVLCSQSICTFILRSFRRLYTGIIQIHGVSD
jgi:hypothetical protein